ncbi:hypothetical protein F4554_005623 [Actinopolymorpha rutila]|uniref:Uncharacterized protein n=1 Tax=Actinopolymorpha rutila TaxID=446787 RepID=A0A852ZLI2_9ACTN|nr:hypothetical protein [Actinopolymorpha rutila]
MGTQACLNVLGQFEDPSILPGAAPDNGKGPTTAMR